MHHNDVGYWRHLQSLKRDDPDLPSPRVCRLLLRMFERWKARPGWLREEQVGHLFRDQKEHQALANEPVIIRKAHAIRRMLELTVDPDIARSAGTFAIVPDELIIGTLPPFSVGQGKEFVRYLREDEELRGALEYLNELSPMGHIVPNHGVVLEQGLEAMVTDARARKGRADTTSTQREFYEAVALSLEAVIGYAAKHASQARAVARELPTDDPNRRSLEQVAECLDVAPREPSRTFHQALQAIFLMHCALHWTVEIVPLGRLDQLLEPYLQRDIKKGALTREQAQELIECFWIKLDERVILDFRNAENRFTAADGVLTGFSGPSNYDQGGLLNQWMQQVTIGGVLPDESPTPKDACNDVTRMCLIAARRLPLNSPTLDLRVHAHTPTDVVDLAAQALLSGGAHPVLLNDDVIVPALAHNSGPPIPLSAARNYACDGCYETMVAGASEFSFGFVSALNVIEWTLNRGAGIAGTGPTFLRGDKQSWRTKPPEQIETFEEFQAILRLHLSLACYRYLRELVRLYGNKPPYAPSPLLSALIDGCIDSGRDLTDGGARYHIFSPLLVGVSNAADSLFVIRELVFGRRAFSLRELSSCLAGNWGDPGRRITPRKVEPFGPHVAPERVQEIRSLCLDQPKFGHGKTTVDELGWWLLDTFVDCVNEAWKSKLCQDGLARLTEKYAVPGRPFVLHLAPGVGTFEQYAYVGSWSGASADGRYAGTPVGSDLSPAPVTVEPSGAGAAGQPVGHSRKSRLESSLGTYAHPVMKRLGDGAPVDYNLPEDFPKDRLVDMIRSFAGGAGGSICTFTVGDPSTFAGAQIDPDRYNLVRVRMGGWTEFFVALYPHHQEQHKRRPLYV